MTGSEFVKISIKSCEHKIIRLCLRPKMGEGKGLNIAAISLQILKIMVIWTIQFCLHSFTTYSRYK
jgi:hypothetical protein